MIINLNQPTEGDNMATIEKALMIATVAHSGSLDKAGEPYILHPLRVMTYLANNQTQLYEKRIVAILHDVIEDTPMTYECLREYGFNELIIEALKSVTKLEGESKMDAARRAIMNPIGRVVKLADLKDNMDLGRIKNPTDKDFARNEKYKEVRGFLEKGLD